MPANQNLAQFLRKLRVLTWRAGYRAYCNAHAGTHVPRDARIATTAKLELETGGSIRLGRGCQLTHYSILSPYGGKIELADHVYVGHFSVIYGHGGVRVGEHTMIAAQVVLIAMSHEFADLAKPIAQQPTTAKGIVIGRDCWIGAGVTVLDGVTIGDGCVVGAGAVVRESMPPNTIAVGVPARPVGVRGAARI